MTAMLASVAPLAVILEGGYNLAATAAGVEATMRVLLGERPPPLPTTTPPVSRIAMMVIHEVISVQVGGQLFRTHGPCDAARLVVMPAYGHACERGGLSRAQAWPPAPPSASAASAIQLSPQETMSAGPVDAAFYCTSQHLWHVSLSRQLPLLAFT